MSRVFIKTMVPRRSFSGLFLAFKVRGLYGENSRMPSGFKGENKHVGQPAGEEGGDPGEAEAGSWSRAPGAECALLRASPPFPVSPTPQPVHLLLPPGFLSVSNDCCLVSVAIIEAWRRWKMI